MEQSTVLFPGGAGYRGSRVISLKAIIYCEAVRCWVGGGDHGMSNRSRGTSHFGAFGADIPVVFWHLQASPYEDRDGAPNHSSEFQIDEAAMAVGTKAFVGATPAYMEANPR